MVTPPPVTGWAFEGFVMTECVTSLRPRLLLSSCAPFANQRRIEPKSFNITCYGNYALPLSFDLGHSLSDAVFHNPGINLHNCVTDLLPGSRHAGSSAVSALSS